jgi:hypothetical protein
MPPPLGVGAPVPTMPPPFEYDFCTKETPLEDGLITPVEFFSAATAETAKSAADAMEIETDALIDISTALRKTAEPAGFDCESVHSQVDLCRLRSKICEVVDVSQMPGGNLREYP